jgi:hypothetical protein
MWIMAGLIVIVAVLIILAGSAGIQFQPDKGKAYNIGFLIGMGLYYALLSFTMIYPALKLWKYANCIGRLVSSRSVADLDAALTEQRRYWKFYGILIIVGICLAIVGFIAFVALVGTAAMKSGMHLPH